MWPRLFKVLRTVAKVGCETACSAWTMRCSCRTLAHRSRSLNCASVGAPGSIGSVGESRRGRGAASLPDRSVRGRRVRKGTRRPRSTLRDEQRKDRRPHGRRRRRRPHARPGAVPGHRSPREDIDGKTAAGAVFSLRGRVNRSPVQGSSGSPELWRRATSSPCIGIGVPAEDLTYGGAAEADAGRAVVVRVDDIGVPLRDRRHGTAGHHLRTGHRWPPGCRAAVRHVGAVSDGSTDT